MCPRLESQTWGGLRLFLAARHARRVFLWVLQFLPSLSTVGDVTFLFNYHDFAKETIACMRNIQMLSIPVISRMSKMFERQLFF